MDLCFHEMGGRTNGKHLWLYDSGVHISDTFLSLDLLTVDILPPGRLLGCLERSTRMSSGPFKHPPGPALEFTLCCFPSEAHL